MAVENDKLEAQIKELQEQLTAANKTIADFNESKFTSQIDKLDKEVAELKSQLEARDAEIKTKSEEIDTIKANLTTLEESKANLEKEIQEVRAAELQAKRVAKLVDGGVEKTKAEEKVELFKSLADEQFDAVAEEIIGAAKAKKDDKDEEDEDKDKAGKKEEEDDDEDDADGSTELEVELEADASLSSSASTQDDKDPNAEARKELADLAMAHVEKIRNKNKKN
jgi:chromosome segregation ATPase